MVNNFYGTALVAVPFFILLFGAVLLPLANGPAQKILSPALKWLYQLRAAFLATPSRAQCRVDMTLVESQCRAVGGAGKEVAQSKDAPGRR